jgi:hypothetical protein
MLKECLVLFKFNLALILCCFIWFNSIEDNFKYKVVVNLKLIKIISPIPSFSFSLWDPKLKSSFFSKEDNINESNEIYILFIRKDIYKSK